MSAELLTVEEVAQILRVTKQRAYELCRQDVLPHVRLGRQIRIHPDRLSEWLAHGGLGLPGHWRRQAEV
jgi:excisionase family DNA binding protein